MFEELGRALFATGPQGILSAVLMLGYIPLGLALRAMFNKHCESETKWMETALDTQTALSDVTKAIELMTERIRVGRK